MSKAIEKDPLLFMMADSTLRNDKEFSLHAVKSSPWCLATVGINLLGDKEIIEAAVS